MRTGLSPRMRGNRRRLDYADAGVRSIPAYAGEPGGSAISSGMCWVYPRVCGGTVAARVQGVAQDGLSPRMRGNRESDYGAGAGRRSIPAYAGEPAWPTWPWSSSRVYPRVCGGTVPLNAMRWGCCGLSPRVRGNP